MTNDPLCPKCNMEIESIIYAVCDCYLINETWQILLSGQTCTKFSNFISFYG
uniref:Uncharacterized protein n=1 Tax=Cajanus cajan TaxID=3821 RepID=A0A151S5P9_CAJCA|nr:hypothetical protein KK1_028120 [Cajanus cajan]